ncbi:MAG: NAD(P)/FAD-dependent oxidoreductase [Egibacteraceae bacterium]
MSADSTADVVVVGGGTIGGWAAHQAAVKGAERVVALERGLVGAGASSRAAGIVRAQGGNETGVRLGRWSIDFYERQRAELSVDSGFRRLGYLLLATSEAAADEAERRVAAQRDLGLDVAWLDTDELARTHPGLAAGSLHGASYAPGDGAIDPDRNVRAYSLALAAAGVKLRERTPCIGIDTAGGPDARRVTGVRTPHGTIATERVVLTGGPTLANVGALVDAPIPAAGVRHQVAVTEPHPELGGESVPMAYDVEAGLYWREHEGGLLFGMSNPQENTGEARRIDWEYFNRLRERLTMFMPATAELGLRKVWAATIDYTPDHLPIIGPALTRSGDAIAGATVASAAGHGMMWGPAVARAAADVALDGKTDVVDVTDLGLDRFDAEGRSRLPVDRIALPFPESVL